MFSLILILLLFFFVRHISVRMKRIEERIEKIERATAIAHVATTAREENKEAVPYDGAHDTAMVSSSEADKQSSATSLQQHDDTFLDKAVQASKVGNIFSRFGAWAVQNPLMKIGILFVLLALIWFAQYSFAQGWIGPVGRIALGLVIATAIMFFGLQDMVRRSPVRGAALFAGGAVGIIAVIGIARHVYDFFTPESALVMMVLPLIVGVVASVRWRFQALATTMALCAFVAPYLTASPVSHFYSLFAYLLAITASACWLLIQQRWSVPSFISATFLMIYSISAAPTFLDDFATKQMLFALLGAVMFGAAVAGLFIRGHIDTKMRRAIAVLMVLSGIYTVLWIILARLHEWEGISLAFAALLFGVVGFGVFARVRDAIAFFAYVVPAAGILGVAIVRVFEKIALLVPMLTIEAFIAVLVVALVLRQQRITAHTTIVYALPAFFFPHLVSKFSYAVFALERSHVSSDFYSTFSTVTYPSLLDVLALPETIAMLFFACGLVFTATLLYFFYGTQRPARTAVSVLAITALAVVFFVVWLVLHASFTTTVATAIALILYSLVGVLFYFVRASTVMYKLGAVILVAVAVRIILIDVWMMNIGGRVITFAIVGGALIATAWRTAHHEDQNTLSK